jgi:hypothetical protein
MKGLELQSRMANVPIDLSVVVASQEGGSGLHRCLASMHPQLSGRAAEIIVVDGSGGDREAQLRSEFAGVRFLRLPPKTIVPKLWSAGINAAQGRIVALTIEQCVPAADWAERVLRAHTAEWLVVGGAIDLDPRAGLVDSAVYFCRYTRYMSAFAAEFLDDLPGDNCSYQRSVLQVLREHVADGFWETFLHQAMRRRGDRLLFDPSLVVYYAGPISGFSFLKGRFLHGKYFAARRGRRMKAAQRVLRAAALPLTLITMLLRIGRRVWAGRRYRMRFLFSVPLILLFLLAWCAGESVGYLAESIPESLPAAKECENLLENVR